MCGLLFLTSCETISPEAQGVIGVTTVLIGDILDQNGNRDLGNIFRGAGSVIAVHAVYRYTADVRQKELARSRARGRSGTYYVKVPPKKGYSGPPGTHLVPYKNGAVAGSVKVVTETPRSGKVIAVGGTQGTVI
jgi:hypothetical protein